MSKKKPMTRSENMARIKAKDTKPEIYIRKLLHKRGFRYRVNYRKLPGSPDIYLPKYRTAVFVNGCFWHQHRNCKYATVPKTNTEYWTDKFRANRERDMKNYESLNSMDIKVAVVWECTFRNMIKDSELENSVIDRLSSFIRSSSRTFEEY